MWLGFFCSFLNVYVVGEVGVSLPQDLFLVHFRLNLVNFHS